MWFRCISLFILLSVNAWATDDVIRREIEDRLKPIGEVQVVKKDVSTSRPLTKSQTESKVESFKEKAGQATYEQYCSVCHQNGIAGAPQFRKAEEWQSRLTAKTLDELVVSAAKGVNAMPMKGTCTECSEEDLKRAIEYMMPQP